MKLNIEFMGSLRRPKNYDRIITIDLPDNSTLKDLLKLLDYSDHEIRMLLAFRKDGSKIIKKDILQDGESLFLTIPIGGG